MLKKTLTLASQGVSPLHTPSTPGPSPGKLRIPPADCQNSSSHKRIEQRISQHPHPSFRLQSSSRAPCLNKRCNIFWGNDEATSHKRQEKIPQCKRASWKTNRTASLPGQRERNSHPSSSSLAKEPVVQGTGERRAPGRKKEADAYDQTYNSAQFSVLEAQPNALFDTVQGATGSSSTFSFSHKP